MDFLIMPCRCAAAAHVGAVAAIEKISASASIFSCYPHIFPIMKAMMKNTGIPAEV